MCRGAYFQDTILTYKLSLRRLAYRSFFWFQMQLSSSSLPMLALSPCIHITLPMFLPNHFKDIFKTLGIGVAFACRVSEKKPSNPHTKGGFTVLLPRLTRNHPGGRTNTLRLGGRSSDATSLFDNNFSTLAMNWLYINSA